MKKIVCFMLMLIFIIINPLKAKAAIGNTIKIAGDENYPPYEFVDKNSYYKGFNVDIMNAISESLGIDIEIKPMPWKDAIEALENKEVEAIQGMTRSAVRDKKFSFSKSLVENTQAIFVRKGTNNIAELSNLTGLTVGIQSEDVSEELANGIPKANIVIYSNQEQAIKALIDGKLDAYIGNRLTGLYILQNLKQFEAIKIVGEPLYAKEYASATLKGNLEILKLLNEGLNNIEKNGEYDRIYNKWFGETFIDNGVVWKRFAIVISAVLFLVLGIIVLIFYWNRSLKRTVTARTSELAASNNALRHNQVQLEQSNRLRGKILENILDGIIVFDKDGNILVTNAAAKQLLRIENREVYNINDLEIDKGFIFKGYMEALKGNVSITSMEWSKGSGEILNIDCSIYPIKSPEDAVEGIIIVLHDYTESKLLNEAKQYDKLKTEFFANISHELRTPLSIISAAAQLLELSSRNTDENCLAETIDKSVNSIRQNINRLARLINNIIDVTKVDTGFLELHLSNCNIVNIIEEVTLSAVDLIENKGITVEFDTDIEEKIIACDVEKIERIILNLLSNSVKFTPARGSIFVKITDEENFVSISVKDTGIGIPKDKQEIIFERFRQVDKSISRNNEGSGIGLSLVKSLIELHGGSIRVKSEYGSGSEFIIKLPAARLQDGEANQGTAAYSKEKTELEFSDIYF